MAEHRDPSSPSVPLEHFPTNRDPHRQHNGVRGLSDDDVEFASVTPPPAALPSKYVVSFKAVGLVVVALLAFAAFYGFTKLVLSERAHLDAPYILPMSDAWIMSAAEASQRPGSLPSMGCPSAAELWEPHLELLRGAVSAQAERIVSVADGAVEVQYVVRYADGPDRQAVVPMLEGEQASNGTPLWFVCPTSPADT